MSRFILGDCVQVMSRFPARAVDFILTDPPYLVGYKDRTGRTLAGEQNSYGLDQVRDGVSLGKDEVNNPIVDYEQIMRLPNLNFYVRLPGEYPVVRLKLKYRPFKKRHAGLIERNIRDALSPELERVIQENERAAAIAGLTFPTGDEVLEKGSETSSADDGPAPVSSAGDSGYSRGHRCGAEGRHDCAAGQ